MKNKYILLWFIFLCFFWLVYSIYDIDSHSFHIFIANLITSPIGIAICSYAIRDNYKFYKAKNILFWYFLFYGLVYLNYDLYLILNYYSSYKDFGLISDVSIIYCSFIIRLQKYE